MKFQPGDLVSFVNEKGGGTVLSVTKNGSYKVALEDGFDLTLPEKELALVSRPETVEAENDHSTAAGQILPEPSARLFETRPGELTFYTAPQAENKVLTGGLSFYLTNDTLYSIHFVLSRVHHRLYYYIGNGILEPGVETETGRFNRHELTEWDHLHIQVLFFNSGTFEKINPLQKDIPLLLPDLAISGTEKGRLAFSRSFNVYRKPVDDEFNPEEIKDKLFSPGAMRTESQKGIKKKQPDLLNDSRYGILRNTKEVDLHIDSISKNSATLQNQEILEVQLSFFRKEMDNAILNHFHSIIFIHGVGEGVLRKAIAEELSNYPGVSWRNASYEKYGAGALEVMLV